LSLIGFGNALLVTGHQKYVDVWRKQIDSVNSNAKEIDGKKQFPHMFGDQGWYDFQSEPWQPGLLEIAYWSMRDDDLARVATNPWIAYLQGRAPNYAESALRADLDQIRKTVAAMRKDTTTPDTRLSDDPMKFNPCSVDSLIRLTLGGMPPGKQGSPLHARLRYFDPQQGRPGLPADVGALIDRLTADEVRVTLVNLHQTEPRALLVVAGAYGEHQFESVSGNGQTHPFNDRRLAVRLLPGSGGTLTLRMKRYHNAPRFE
jgi:hypothetical protein